MVIESNILIAEFMGGVKSFVFDEKGKRDKSVPNLINLPQNRGDADIYSAKGSEVLYNGTYTVHRLNELKYHESWDWLMPVVQKCYKIDNEEGFDNLVDAVSTLDIYSTYKAVIEFIKEYSVLKEEIKEFIEQWGQSPEEIKNNLEEIYNYEIKADDDFILNTGNYKWCEEYAVWITDNYETQSHDVYKHLGLA